MKKIIVSCLYIILFLTSCASSENSQKTIEPIPISTPAIEEYVYIETLEPYGFNELNDKYIGNEIDWVVKDQDTNEDLDISKINTVKIIELYSGFCDVCLTQASFVDKLIKANESISYISIAKEKSSVETSRMREKGFAGSLYYFPDEIPIEAAKLWDLGRPGYIIVDEENKIMFLTGGNLNSFTYKTVFNPIADILNPPKEATANDDNSEFCELCQ